MVDDSARGVSDLSHFAKVNPDITQQVVFCTEAWHFVNRQSIVNLRERKKMRDVFVSLSIHIYSILYLLAHNVYWSHICRTAVRRSSFSCDLPLHPRTCDRKKIGWTRYYGKVGRINALCLSTQNVCAT